MIQDFLIMLGWESVPSKNKYMYSFKKDERRVNLYYTTSTLTIQDKFGNQTIHKDVTMENVEQLLFQSPRHTYRTDEIECNLSRINNA